MGERYLYEYDYDKPELTEEFLEHHGVKGMKWGVRKDRYSGLSGAIRRHRLKKKRKKALQKAREIRAKNAAAAKENQKTKEQIIADHDHEALMKNIKLFSTQEINDFNKRSAAIKLATDNAKAMQQANKTKGQKIKDFVISNMKKAATDKAQEIIQNNTKKLIGKFTDSLFSTSNKSQDKKDSQNQQQSSKKDSKKEESKSEDTSSKNIYLENESKKLWDRATKANERAAEKREKQELKETTNEIKKYYNNQKIDETLSRLTDRKKQLNLDYAKSVASKDSNSADEKEYRYYVQKDINDIDKQMEKLKRKKQ